MSDIVKRLAKCAAVSEIIKDNPKIYCDAMYEIERLRAENEKILDGMRDTIQERDILSGENYDLRKEIEKLREALAQERERCAKIAERYLSNNEPVRLTASSIAAEIRESE